MRQENIEKRDITVEQAAAISLKHQMGKALRQDVENKPEVVAELNSLLHSELTYKEIVRTFLESRGTPEEIINSPFVKMLEEANILDEEEINTLRGSQDKETVSEFIEDNISKMKRGFQFFVLYHSNGLAIDPLSEEEARNKTLSGSKKWREANPERAIEMLQKMREEITHEPHVFTRELRNQIQDLFNEGYNYEETAALILYRHGIRISTDNLKSAVFNYEDLNYPHKERFTKLQSGIAEVFDLTGTTNKTNEIVRSIAEGLGRNITNERIALFLRRAGKRERIDWNQELEIDGNVLTLGNLVEHFINNPSYEGVIVYEYKALKSYLEENNLNIKISKAAYEGKRKRLLDNK